MSGRTVAGRYRLDRLIGRGGAGAVWRGHDERLHRAVAVKQISFPADGTQAEIGKARALREARAAARLGDAGVVQIYDIIEEDESAYLIMELVDAPNLSVLVRRAGPLQPHSVAALGIRMLETLVAGHRAGIVHRDIKPSNVLVDGHVPRLTDFGIARLGDESTITSTGMVMGTPAYIAPEHARGEAVGPPADLYGLGATLYYAVEGTAPFGERSSVATVMAVLDRRPRRPRRAGPLTALLDDLLAKDPADRPGADEVRDRLVAVRDAAQDGADDVDAPVAMRPPSTAAEATSSDAATADTDEVDRAGVVSAPVADAAAASAVDAVSAPAVAGEPPVAADDGAAAPPERGSSVPADTPPPSRRRPAAFGVLAIVALALLAALGLRPDGDGGDEQEDGRPQGSAAAPAASPSPVPEPPSSAVAREDGSDSVGAAPSAAPTSDAGPPSPAPVAEDGVLPANDVEVPDDWETFVPNDAPYRVAHPPGWQVVERPGTLTDIRDPDSGTYLRLDWVAARRDPVDAWETFEPTFAARQDDYRRLALESTTYKGDPAALWEYRYRSGGTQLHAYNLGVNAGEFGFALNLQARQENFAEARELWPYFLASYEFTGR
ncbi:MAG: protein kinase [Actinobacteria bacterium]|nr:protein kinase [Actinomycetota bacterium]